MLKIWNLKYNKYIILAIFKINKLIQNINMIKYYIS